jgi:type I restriction enzyme R subunit
MINRGITESEVEQAALDILSAQGYGIVHGPDISPDGSHPERQSYSDVVLMGRLRDAIDRLNPKIPTEAKEEAIKQLLRSESPDLVVNNHRFHKMLFEGVDVEYRKGDRIVPDKVWLFDFNDVDKNEFLAVNQFTIIENNHNRRPDIILFVNGLPLVVIELKNPADENATVHSAFKQFQTYKLQIPSLFHFAEVLIASDGFDAKAGTITSDWERFQPWKTMDGKEKAPKAMPQIEVLIKGLLKKEVLLDLVRHFVVFEQEKDSKDGSLKISKKIAAYHQYFAVNKAIEETGLTLKAPVMKAVLAALSERDETADICKDKEGKPEPDAELRDAENVPLSDNIYDYFKREVSTPCSRRVDGPEQGRGWLRDQFHKRIL